MNWNPAALIGSLFYDRHQRVSQPHPWAFHYWALWTLTVPLIPMFPGSAPWVLVAFLIPELTAAVYLDPKGYGKFTYSQTVWWYINRRWLRVVWGLTLAVIGGTYVATWAGMLLALWLIPHFAYRSRR